MIHQIKHIAGKRWKLIIDKEFNDTMGNPPCCQTCGSILSFPFYWCKRDIKWFCKDCCVNPKRENCKFEKKKALFPDPNQPMEHKHRPVTEIEVLKGK